MCTIYLYKMFNFYFRSIFFSLLFVTYFISMSEAEEKHVQCEKIDYKDELKTCFLNGITTIDSRGFFISSANDHGMQQLSMVDNKKVFFLPDNIDEKLPNLLKIDAHSCSIKSISNGVFDNLAKLKELFLHYNQISEIESETFKDLISLEKLDLCEY